MFFYAIAGYCGTRSKSSGRVVIVKGQGPDDGPAYFIYLKDKPLIPNLEPVPVPHPEWQIDFAKLGHPDPFPALWSIGTGLVGGLMGGFVGSVAFPDSPVFALAGAVFGGRIINDVVNALKGSNAKTL